MWVPAGLRAAHPGRSKPRNLASKHGTAFRPAKANHARANPKKCVCVLVHFFTYLLLLLKRQSSCQRIRSHGRGTTAALQAFLFCDSHERCFCEWVRERACVCACVNARSYSSRNQEQSQAQRPTSAFFAPFNFCCAVSAAAVYLYHTVSF